MNQLTVKQAESLLRMNNGASPPKVFSVRFYKRGDKKGIGKNEIREMVCFPSSVVKKGLAGGERAYNEKEHGLFTTYLSNLDPGFDKQSPEKNRRCINLRGLIKLKIAGTEYEVLGKPED